MAQTGARPEATATGAGALQTEANGAGAAQLQQEGQGPAQLLLLPPPPPMHPPVPPPPPGMPSMQQQQAAMPGLNQAKNRCFVVSTVAVSAHAHACATSVLIGPPPARVFAALKHPVEVRHCGPADASPTASCVRVQNGNSTALYL
jgi:hypothetical protein